jgi:hypothetical protein
LLSHNRAFYQVGASAEILKTSFYHYLAIPEGLACSRYRFSICYLFTFFGVPNLKLHRKRTSSREGLSSSTGDIENIGLSMLRRLVSFLNRMIAGRSITPIAEGGIVLSNIDAGENYPCINKSI